MGHWGPAVAVCWQGGRAGRQEREGGQRKWGAHYSQRGLVVGEAVIRLRIGWGAWGCWQLPSNKCQEHPGDRGGEVELPPFFRVQGSEAREIGAVAWSVRPRTPVG